MTTTEKPMISSYLPNLANMSLDDVRSYDSAALAPALQQLLMESAQPASRSRGGHESVVINDPWKW